MSLVLYFISLFLFYVVFVFVFSFSFGLPCRSACFGLLAVLRSLSVLRLHSLLSLLSLLYSLFGVHAGSHPCFLKSMPSCVASMCMYVYVSRSMSDMFIVFNQSMSLFASGSKIHSIRVDADVRATCFQYQHRREVPTVEHLSADIHHQQSSCIEHQLVAVLHPDS